MKQLNHQFHKFLFHISKCLKYNAEKRLQLKITKKKRMNKANFINQIIIPILYVTRMTPNKNDSINSILQHGRVVEGNFFVVFLTSRYPYFSLCPR